MSARHCGARQLIAATLLIVVGVLSGCAHQNTRDPLEPLNRGIYTFNDAVDRAVLKPVATGYRAVLPQVVRTGVSNFFSNLDDITVFINNVLQIKIPQAASDAGRFLINTTIGVLGLFDVATQLGLEKHNEDFGQTLGYWGLGNGPFLMLPFLGPSSLRDGVGRLVDVKSDVVAQIDHIRTRNQFYGTRVISNREHLLDSEKVLDAAAIDRYAFLRDAYLQRRRSLVYDGSPPPEPEDEDFNGKPQSELQSAPISVLVDQYGGIVAGPSEILGPQPLGETQAVGAPKTADRPSASLPQREADPAASAPVPRAPDAPSESSVSPVSVEPATGFVRMWLSGAASR
ncbi:MAG: VacJ family lipoprotein [Betaproteobacteria bacterium]|nr:MAG: VacJ family lipoprotein [Betaproteobacteria bacterium]